MKVALSQIAPVWLNKAATIAKIITQIEEASKAGVRLVVFGEALLPGYPFWVERTDGARFNDAIQKDIFAHYAEQAVCLESGDLAAICGAAKKYNIAIYQGVIERPKQRAGHSLYCSLVYINPQGEIKSVHRKLMPTYEERLVWSIGDGNGLRVHVLDEFTVGGLNCWENWMPLTRAALYAQGENLHVAVWPGNKRNTVDLTRHIAKESRSYVLSVSGLMRKQDITSDMPHHEKMLVECPDFLANGGSCIAAPNGDWVIAPVIEKEALLIADLDIKEVRRERHNFDPSGHYSRPDVLKLEVNRERQAVVKFL